MRLPKGTKTVRHPNALAAQQFVFYNFDLKHVNFVNSYIM